METVLVKNQNTSEFCAVLCREGDRLSLMYLTGYTGPPLAPCFPVSEGSFAGKVVADFFRLFLPEGQNWLRIAKEYRLDEADPLSLLFRGEIFVCGVETQRHHDTGGKCR